MKKITEKNSMTLLELMVVVIIIGIISGIGISQYYPVKERALAKEALASIKLIWAAERIYYMENAEYYPQSGTESDISDINSNLKLALRAQDWAYSVDSSGTAYADRQGTGSYSTCKYRIRQNESEPSVDSGTCISSF